MHTADCINAWVAAGTWAAVVVALFGDRVRACLFGPRLRLEIQGPKEAPPGGELLSGNRIYYKLKVVNSRRSSATNCRVLLTYLQRRLLNDQFAPVPLP
jgi:hypothetical protein